jgi:hypothetical protein
MDHSTTHGYIGESSKPRQLEDRRTLFLFGSFVYRLASGLWVSPKGMGQKRPALENLRCILPLEQYFQASF